MEMRDDLAGRRGVLKYKAGGIAPMTAIRGVATCSWHINESIVYVPLSPKIQFRAAKNGDKAILLRCPALSYDSLQAVSIHAWDNDSIGVHPNYCDYLKLDFDGDEVHLLIVTDPISSDHRFSKLLDDVVPKTIYEEPADRLYNYFAWSTLRDSTAVTMLSEESHKQVGNKPGPWSLMQEVMSDPFAYRAKFQENSKSALHNLTQSNLRVAEGHIYGRQLRCASMQVSSSNNVVRSSWLQSGQSQVMAMKIPSGVNGVLPESGYPGARLSSRISKEVTQLLLDMAKRAISSTTTSRGMMSLLGDDDPYYVISDRTHVSSSSREWLSKINPPELRYSKIVAMLAYACQLLNVKTTPRELYELAYCIYGSTELKDCPALTGSNQMAFLSKTSSNVLSIGIADDLRHEFKIRAL
ncbi:hypothetical protein HDU99_006288 [Rhizoclosmatium hyalinum]|nr:hypothetical protein HDU99_006288 [Rhizoclosmatium hyalinum]